jgi:hypothetical protein
MFSKLGRSMSRSVGLSRGKTYKNKKSLKALSNIDMNHPLANTITSDTIKCKGILPHLNVIKDHDLREKIRNLCDYKSRYPNSRRTSVKYVKGSKSASANPLVNNMLNHYGKKYVQNVNHALPTIKESKSSKSISQNNWNRRMSALRNVPTNKNWENRMNKLRK